MSERFISAINLLQKDFEVCVINSGQASFNTNYDAKNNYQQYVIDNFHEDNILNTSAVSNPNRSSHRKVSEEIIKIIQKLISNNTVAIILDDSRHSLHSDQLYNIAKERGVLVFANTHGNGSYDIPQKKIYDYLFCLGEYDKGRYRSKWISDDQLLCAGIPANDSLKSYTNTKEYILILCNFISPTSGFDSSISDKMGIRKLQEKLGLPVLFKLKHRLQCDIEKEVMRVREKFPESDIYQIIHDVDSENDLISKAACVLTYGSTMALKPIQMKIPTIIFKELGRVGCFDSYYNLVSLEDNYDLKTIEDSNRIFLDKVIMGGRTFSSTKDYLNHIYRIIGK
jgi:hypothetical protein